MFCVTATLNALSKTLGLDWSIHYHGINVADAASGSGGDVTVRVGERVIMVAEVTERPLKAERIAETFDSKIAPNSIDDYLFFLCDSPASEPAVEQARKYFFHGHDINFVNIESWTTHMLTLVGPAGRSQFLQELVREMSVEGVPTSLKVAWNNLINDIAAGK
jgi:hypothetical protein